MRDGYIDSRDIEATKTQNLSFEALQTDRKKGVGEWSVEQQHTQLCDTDACFFTSLLAAGSAAVEGGAEGPYIQPFCLDLAVISSPFSLAPNTGCGP